MTAHGEAPGILGYRGRGHRSANRVTGTIVQAVAFVMCLVSCLVAALPVLTGASWWATVAGLAALVLSILLGERGDALYQRGDR